MFQNTKNLSHQQAFQHIQSLFPSLSLPAFSSNASLKNILDSISNSLPLPQTVNHHNTLQSMKSIVDTQQYKIQRNMIQIENYNEYTEFQGCSLDFYQQRSTTIDFIKKQSDQTSGNSMMSDQSEDIWWNNQHKQNSQEELQKQCFSFLD